MRNPPGMFSFLVFFHLSSLFPFFPLLYVFPVIAQPSSSLLKSPLLLSPYHFLLSFTIFILVAFLFFFISFFPFLLIFTCILLQLFHLHIIFEIIFEGDNHMNITGSLYFPKKYIIEKLVLPIIRQGKNRSQKMTSVQNVVIT